jgi:DNA-binding transcriptional ArsR family regulator
MTPTLKWGRFPSEWMKNNRLRDVLWKRYGTRGTAGLRVYLILAHRLIEEDGVVKATYDEIEQAANLSRQSVSHGLDVLEDLGLIERGAKGRGTYKFCDYDPERGWAMVPSRPLYSKGQFRPFKDWTLRKMAEFDALKIYLFIAAARDANVNETFTKYENIKKATGVPDSRITAGLSLLTVSGLIHAIEIDRDGFGMSRSYRLIGLDTRRHAATAGRANMGQADPLI